MWSRKCTENIKDYLPCLATTHCPVSYTHLIDDEANYDLSDKMFEYSMEKINILSDFIDGKISRDEEIAKFYELSDKVHDDFYAVDIMINKRLEEKGVIPVSYTHLDVYKRQAHFLALNGKFKGQKTYQDIRLLIYRWKQ